MDHLPIIKGPAYAVPQIACLCQPNDYDGQGIAGFPERMGWRIDRILGAVRLNEREVQIKSPGALLQSWLYFGVICDFFQIGGLNVDLKDFVYDLDSELFVTSASLRVHLDKLAASAQELNRDERLQRQQLIRDILRQVFGFFDIYWDAIHQFDRWRASSVLSLDSILSIVILGETFKNAGAVIWPVDPSPLQQVYNFRPQNPLQDRLHKLGWCPNENLMLFRELDVTGLYLASLLKRPFSQRLQHERCSDEECSALQTSETDYETAHAKTCSDNTTCPLIMINQEKLSSILHNGSFPILYVPFEPEDSTPIEVKVLESKSERMEYVAFSHVWAHGMGNPKENSLPQCQVLRLKQLCAKLGVKGVLQPAFWIDTLCIPVASEHKDARKLAIRRMADTYRQSRRVLVVDADLQQCSKQCSRTELVTRVLCCGWMRRLWTLQEAVIAEKTSNASKLDIQFLEGPLEFNAIAGKSVKSLYHTETAMRSVFSAFPQFTSRDRSYAFLTRALKYRTTSKREDEAVCLGPLLGLDPDQISAILGENSADARMQRLYNLMGQIPAAVLFNSARKLKNNLRWAPASLLGLREGIDLSNRSVAKCDTDGLHVQFGGWIIRTHAFQRQQLPTAQIDRVFFGNPQSSFPKAMMTPKATNHHREIYLATVDFDKLMKDITTPAFILNPQDSNESALVSVTSEENGIIHAVYLRKIQIKQWFSESSFNAKAYRRWRNHLIDGDEILSDQRWCIR